MNALYITYIINVERCSQLVGRDEGGVDSDEKSEWKRERS
jgi:hypothetical protein